MIILVDDRQIVKDFLINNYGNVEGLETMSLYYSNYIDSTGILELVGFLEETFDIEIKTTHITGKHLDNLDSIVDLVKTLRGCL